jgi:hypothetical protein
VPDDLLCPSASADAPDAMVIGVVGGTVDSPHVRMLERPVPVSPAVLAATAPVGPGEVLRVAATCLKDRCRHSPMTDARSERRSSLRCRPWRTGFRAAGVPPT